ncbi:MAG: glycosyltransferase family 39 protein [Chloroflexi bacterium]|nr:glycosyltransferase family 39 protein [Chloroflexota bacterium]
MMQHSSNQKQASATGVNLRASPAQKRYPNIARNGLILALLLFAFALRLYKVTSIPFSVDEVVTITRLAPLSIADIFGTYYSNNHPLASLLAHLFSPQVNHLFMLRWPFILVGLIALPFVYRLGAGLFGQPVGLLALFLLSVTPVYIGYSVIVRGYGGLISLSAIALYFLWQALRRNRWRDWLGFVAASVLAAFFHLFSLLAMGMALGLVGIGLLWDVGRNSREFKGIQGNSEEFRGTQPQFRPVPPSSYKFLKFSLVTLMLSAVYGLLIYVRVTSILAEGGYSGEFEIWRDGFSSSQDLSPLVIFIGLMGPMSPGGVAAYIYLIFGLVGLACLWRQQRLLALATVIWFLAPFLIIFVAMQLLGRGFYAYVRFLLYLLPSYLILVAVGMLACFEGLSILSNRSGQQRRVAISMVKWAAVGGWLMLLALSINWYMVRATNADWPGLADTLSHELQPQDIVVCEEYQRDLTAPDRAKPYCLWMLEFFTELTGYTPRLQNTTDFIANYEHVQAHRTAMLAPGGVWLVIWQKIVFNVEHLITDEPPMVKPLPLAAFARYQTWRFGSALLIHIDSEKTLFGNIYQAVERLAQVEQSPAAKARYYRSLAELEAAQGHADQAREFLQKSQVLVEQSGGDVDSFLAKTQQVVALIPADHPPPRMAYPTSYKLGPALCLQAYDVSPATLEAGHSLVLTLYWQAVGVVDKDYTFFLRLDHQADQGQSRLEFEPFDRTYPTSWWWPGQQLVERHQFDIPVDLGGQDYVVQIGVYDRRSPDQQIVAPLFFLRYQPAAAQTPRWRIEAVAQPGAGCS